MKTAVIYDAVFDAKVHLLVADAAIITPLNIDQYVAVQGLKPLEHVTNYQAICYGFGRNEGSAHMYEAVLVVPGLHDKPELAGLIAHELLHVVAQVMRDIGVKLCSKSEEVYAYYLNYFITEAHKQLNKNETNS